MPARQPTTDPAGRTETAEEVQMAPTSSASQVQEVNPSVDEPTQGITTMKDMFGSPQVVDGVVPVAPPQGDDGIFWFVIRPSEKIEDMTVGSPSTHYAFEEGIRYRVPENVAQILYNRDKLMEVPFPWKE